MLVRALLVRPVLVALILILSLISSSALSHADDNSSGSAKPTATAIPWAPPEASPTSTPVVVKKSSPPSKAKPTSKPKTSPKGTTKPGTTKPKASGKPSPGSRPKTSGKPAPSRPAPRKQPAYVVPPGWPKMLYIPRIKVSAPVEAVALNRISDFKAPYKWGDVAWYDRGPRPGDMGRATFFGHLDSYCCPAVFYELKQLKQGDIVQVAYKTGKPLTFKVMWQAVYPNTRLPTSFLFGRVSERGISLITCTGVFHRDGTGYDHKLIVYARAVLPNGKPG